MPHTALLPSSLPDQRHPLTCHPATPCPVPLQLSAALAVAGSESGPGLLLCYELRGDLADLCLPAAAEPGPADGLWQHTCFEAFVARPGEPAYREFNFSPSGQWAAYRFRSERVRDAEAETACARSRPVIECVSAPGQLLLQAWLPLQNLPAVPPGQPLLWGLTAVLEHAAGRLSYWALHHPGPRPDFHHSAGRTLALALPTQALPRHS